MANTEKAAERNAKERVLRRFARHISGKGFAHTKPSFYVRPSRLVVEFVHLHKYTFASAFRPHLGIRVFNETLQSVHLNGPTSDAYKGPESLTGSPHDFTFDASNEAVDRCALNLAEYVEFYAEPWFTKWHDPVHLVESDESPLHPLSRAGLAQALAGKSDAALVARSRKLLNVT
jgi:hypothetical protein